jgi:hypothetical protein
MGIRYINTSPSIVQAHLVALDTTVNTLEAQLQQKVEQLQGRLNRRHRLRISHPHQIRRFRSSSPATHQASEVANKDIAAQAPSCWCLPM